MTKINEKIITLIQIVQRDDEEINDFKKRIEQIKIENHTEDTTLEIRYEIIYNQIYKEKLENWRNEIKKSIKSKLEEAKRKYNYDN
jgi:hypothetical protein